MLKEKNLHLIDVRNDKISKEKCLPCLDCFGSFNPKTLIKRSKHCAGEGYKSGKSLLL